jgi:gliding motility-associated-like protein
MFNTQVLFSNYSTGANAYQWYFEEAVPLTSTSEDAVATFPDGVSGYYNVSLIVTSDLGCIDTVTKIVPVMPEVLIYAPNAFTPDGDEFNQTWKVHMEGIDLYDFELLIFDRWGEVVWESHDIEASWDGTFNGRVMAPGAYQWTIRTKDLLNDRQYVYNGTLVLIR